MSFQWGGPLHKNILLTKDLLYSSLLEKRKHKKRLVMDVNSYVMDVKCQACYKITILLAMHKR